jgi:hypothetical protein
LKKSPLEAWLREVSLLLLAITTIRTMRDQFKVLELRPLIQMTLLRRQKQNKPQRLKVIKR